MVNFSRIPLNSGLGKSLRLLLKLLPPDSVVVVFQGGLKGYKWIVGSGVHGYWLGSYEEEQQNLFIKLIKKGSVVYDIGAHVGFYTLLASKLVGDMGQVFSFEPLPRNVYYLKRHIQLNKRTNIRVFQAAVGDRSGALYFTEGNDSSTGHISENGQIAVKAFSIDDLVLTQQIPYPGFIKIDTEGAELSVLRGGEYVLREFKPIIFLSTHGDKIKQECINHLQKNNYKINWVTRDFGIAAYNYQ